LLEKFLTYFIIANSTLEVAKREKGVRA